MYCLQEIHFKYESIAMLKLKGWKTMFHATPKQKKAGVVLLISDKVDFRMSNVIRDKAWYYIMIKRSVHQENKNS